MPSLVGPVRPRREHVRYLYKLIALTQEDIEGHDLSLPERSSASVRKLLAGGICPRSRNL